LRFLAKKRLQRKPDPQGNATKKAGKIKIFFLLTVVLEFSKTLFYFKNCNQSMLKLPKVSIYAILGGYFYYLP
jgi:hypothetical protein